MGRHSQKAPREGTTPQQNPQISAVRFPPYRIFSLMIVHGPTGLVFKVSLLDGGRPHRKWGL